MNEKVKRGVNSLLEDKRQTNPEEYYKGKGEEIKALGFINPLEDVEDFRQKEAFNLITERKGSITIEHSDLSDLAPFDHPYQKYFQSRDQGAGNYEDMSYDFYEHEVIQERLPFAMRVEGEIFFGIGNRRGRAHELAIKERRHQSKCYLIMIELPDATKIDYFRLGSGLAYIGNKPKNDTRPIELRRDAVHELKARHDLECLVNPQVQKWSPEKCIEHYKSFIIDRHPSLGYEKNKSVLGRVLNGAFDEDICRPLEIPSTSLALKTLWNNHFKVGSWDGSRTDFTDLNQPICHTAAIHQNQVTDLYMDRIARTSGEKGKLLKTRPSIYLICSVDKSGSSTGKRITSLTTLENRRTSILAYLTQQNLDIRRIEWNHPLHLRVLFPVQLDDPRDKAEAWEWDAKEKHFVKVS